MRTLAFAILVPLLLAGCASPAGVPSDDEPTSDAGGAIPLALTDCRFVVAYVPVAAAALEPYLPEGFRLTTSNSPFAPVVGEAYLGVEAFQCAEGAYGSFFTSAAPPEEIQRDVDITFVKWDTLVADESRRSLLASRGLPVRGGSTEVLDVMGARPTASLTMEGVGTFRIEGVSTMPPGGGFEATFAEYQPTEGGGIAVWNATFTSPGARSGRAVVTLEPGSWAAEVIDREQVEAPMLTGTWTFQGEIHAPPASA